MEGDAAGSRDPTGRSLLPWVVLRALAGRAAAGLELRRERWSRRCVDGEDEEET
jgi:hypothetical protein